MVSDSDRRIEDYALIGDCHSLALIHRHGSIDWLGMPRFDSAACFASLLGDPRHGRWLLAPAGTFTVTRHYRDRTLILETDFESEEGSVRVIDFMAHGEGLSHVIRIVRGLRGTVPMRTELIVRFDYGSRIPWVSRQDDGRLRFAGGPDCLYLSTKTVLRGEEFKTVGDFNISQGEELSFALTWARGFEPAPTSPQPAAALKECEDFWEHWAAQFKPSGEWPDAVHRSLITLRALAHADTGGIVAAGTTSLPEKIGGRRNWDYRYCWLRDATFTLYALIGAGYASEGEAWLRWLQRAVGGSPEQLQTMYGVAGERRLTEFEIPTLPGFCGSKPVRIGNAASEQLQLDVYGEILDAFYVGHQAGLKIDKDSWALQCALLEHLEKIWEQPDASIWEVRGHRKQFTYSKVMVWVAFDRAIRTVERDGRQVPLERWRKLRDHLHRTICERGFNQHLNSFTQAFGSEKLDASLLRIALVGFLPADDPRVLGTVQALERNLMHDGLLLRYDNTDGSDGQPPGEGAFLACSFWLVDNYVLQERWADARELFVRLLSLCNDVGLLAEEYDPVGKRQLGNFPQAFSHLALVNSARNLTGNGPAQHRSRRASSADPACGLQPI